MRVLKAVYTESVTGGLVCHLNGCQEGTAKIFKPRALVEIRKSVCEVRLRGCIYTEACCCISTLLFCFISRNGNKECNKGRGENKQESDSLIHLQLQYTLSSANSEMSSLHM